MQSSAEKRLPHKKGYNHHRLGERHARRGIIRDPAHRDKAGDDQDEVDASILLAAAGEEAARDQSGADKEEHRIPLWRFRKRGDQVAIESEMDHLDRSDDQQNSQDRIWERPEPGELLKPREQSQRAQRSVER